MGRWCGQLMPLPSQNNHHLLPRLNPDWFYLSAISLPRLSSKSGRKADVVVVLVVVVPVVVVVAVVVIVPVVVVVAVAVVVVVVVVVVVDVSVVLKATSSSIVLRVLFSLLASEMTLLMTSNYYLWLRDCLACCAGGK